MIYVIAAAHRQGVLWCRQNHVEERDVVIVSEPQRLLGHRWQEGDKLVRTGTTLPWATYIAIEEQLRVMGCPREEVAR